MKHMRLGLGLIALSGLAAFAAVAQTVPADVRAAEFTAENAIVDTAIPFAIGASEARQSLRGAFGWPTFQEGLVEGVYFRFDPDGYARFSPNPRLDVDVFEVLCKARTQECHARKAGLTIFLTARGELQMAVDGVIAGDNLFLSEGVSEIQVPDRVLQPLDAQMENLLASSLELIVRRGGEEVSRYSLRGFSATTAYLRWIANGQDYAVLPRDWPVPNGRQVAAGQRLTQQSSWQSPMPQPQVIAITQPTPQSPQIATGHIDSQLADLRSMVEQLRHPAEAEKMTGEQKMMDAAMQPPTGLAVDRLEALLVSLTEDVQALKQASLESELYPSPKAVLPSDIDPSLVQPAGVTHVEPDQDTTDKLAYLVEVLGLDLRTAVAVLELAATSEDITPSAAKTSSMTQDLFSQALLDGLMKPEIEMVAPQEMTEPPAIVIEQEPIENSVVQPVPIATVSEYMLLSDYFRSAVMPALQAAPPVQ